MSNFAVQNPEFWKARMLSTPSWSKSCAHHVVFKCPLATWELVEKNHLKVIKDVINLDEHKVIDLGCGPGREYVKDISNYVGVDISPDFIAKAKAKFPQKNFSVCRLQDLPYEENTFDWGICSSIREMIIRECGATEWHDIEREIMRICKRVLVLEYTLATQENYDDYIVMEKNV